MTRNSSLYRSTEGETVVRTAYERALAKWPVEYKELRVATRWGSTTVYSCGAGSALPIVLFHGMSVSSPSWYPTVGALAGIRHVYAVDYPGDFGKSDHRTPPATREEAAEWVFELLDKLGIETTDMLGKSFGAFLAANAATRIPDRASRLVLISPAAVFTRLRTAFYPRAFLASMISTAVTRESFLKWLHAPGNYERDEFTELFDAALRFGRPRLRFAPTVLRDSELRRLTMPVLYLAGEHEVIVDPVASTRRARQLLSDGHVEMIAGAGHGITVEQTRRTNELITRFLNET